MNRILLTGLVAWVIWSCNERGETHSRTDTTAHDTHTAAGPNHMKLMHDAMMEMMRHMEEMSPAGDPDYDFAMMMKLHHEGAVKMSRAEIEGGTDETMRSMAQRIIQEQQAEVDSFNRFLQEKPSGTSGLGERLKGMMTPMEKIRMESGSLDAMFASMMIPHHDDAVKMAREYLKVGKNESLRKIAEDILVTQPQQIQEMQQWLNSYKSNVSMR